MIEKVSFSSRAGDTAGGSLAAPSGDRRHPALLVCHEWWGVNAQIERTATRFADEGFLTLVVDVYRGAVARDEAEAKQLMNGLDWKRAMDDLAGALEYLRGHPRSTGTVAITGFCMGGALTLAAAAQLPGLAAAVPFYGVPGGQDWTKVTAPVQAHFSKTDGWAKPEVAASIQSTIQGAGGTMELHLYDAEHAFMNEARPEVHDPAAAQQAWTRAVTFLREHTR